jgi:hypothetical protein
MLSIVRQPEVLAITPFFTGSYASFSSLLGSKQSFLPLAIFNSGSYNIYLF